MLKESYFLAALGGLTILAATSVSAQAQCANCSYQTYYNPVVVKHCRHVVPHTVLRPVVTQHVVPVVRYQTVQRTHYVPQTYYSTYTTTPARARRLWRLRHMAVMVTAAKTTIPASPLAMAAARSAPAWA